MLEKISALRVVLLTLAVAYWQTLFTFIEEADTRFVMNLGKYVLEHGFPHVDPFTVHENLQLVAQQWLSGVLFWEAYKNFGPDGLLVVDYVFGSAAVIIYWRLCLLVSGGKKILAFSMALVAGILIAPAIVPRPHTLSLPLLVGEVFLLEKFTLTGNEKFLLPLPLISIALVNLHAAVWAMSLVLCLPFLFVKNLRHGKFLLAAMAGIFFCGLINPYGLDAMTYVLRSYGVDLINSHIAEMFTPSAHDIRGKIFYGVAALTIFSFGKFKLPWRYFFLSGGIIFMAVMHWRNMPLFYLVATVPLAFAWRNLTAPKIFSDNARALVIFLFLAAVNVFIITRMIVDGLDKLPALAEIFFLATIIFVLYNLLVVKAQGRILHPSVLPRKIYSFLATALIFGGIFFATIYTRPVVPKTYTQAIEFILRNERPENISLYAGQGIGGLAGSYGIKYYIDARSEVFLDANNGKKNILEEYLDFTSGKIFYKDFFARYDFTHIILTNESPFLFELVSGDKNFRVIYESERADGSEIIRCKVFVPK